MRSVQLLVELGSGACTCAFLFEDVESLANCSTSILTTFLPALERSEEGVQAKDVR